MAKEVWLNWILIGLALEEAGLAGSEAFSVVGC